MGEGRTKVDKHEQRRAEHLPQERPQQAAARGPHHHKGCGTLPCRQLRLRECDSHKKPPNRSAKKLHQQLRHKRHLRGGGVSCWPRAGGRRGSSGSSQSTGALRQTVL